MFLDISKLVYGNRRYFMPDIFLKFFQIVQVFTYTFFGMPHKNYRYLNQVFAEATVLRLLTYSLKTSATASIKLCTVCDIALSCRKYHYDFLH